MIIFPSHLTLHDVYSSHSIVKQFRKEDLIPEIREVIHINFM